jgi:hypothetical protein
MSDDTIQVELKSLYQNGFVHLPSLVGCLAGTVLLTKLSSLLAPFNLYFTFTELVKSGEGGYGLLPFLVKMLIPFSVGALFFHHQKERDLALSSSPSAINLELTAAAGSAFGALLLSWPAIVLWEFVVSAPIYGYRVQFIVVYALYVVSFAYLSSAGVMAARLVWLQGDASRLKGQLKTQSQLIAVVWAMIFALATGGFADWASKQLAPT